MVDFAPKVDYVDGTENRIKFDHRSGHFQVSGNVEVSTTEDGKLRATFKNSEPQKPTFLDMIRELCGKRFVANDSDCSIVINNTDAFISCKREGDTYTLEGGGATFTGTDRPDKLVMESCKNTTVDLKDGDDSLEVLNKNTTYEVKDNTINMGDGDDKVSIKGKFTSFKNNAINLDRGRDSVEAEINPENDTGVTTRDEYAKNEDKYCSIPYDDTKIYATRGNDTFKSKTFTANKLIRNLFGFDEDNVTFKKVPQRPKYEGPIPQTPDSAEAKPELFGSRIEATTKPTDKEECERRLRWAAAGDLVTGGSVYVGLLSEIVNSWAKDNPPKK